MRGERRGLGRGLVVTLGILGGALGAGCNGGGGSANSPDSETLPLGEYQDGIITFYDATGAGNCSFDPSPQDLDVAAINIGQYQASGVCGACAEIQGPKGSLRVRIVDSCPDCTTRGHLDLSRSAFAKLANPVDGRVKVTWRLVTCDTPGPVSYHIKDGSSPYWVAIQVRNHLLPVTKLEYWKSNAWVALQRETYNYFTATQAGPGPLKVRVTAMDGQTLEDTLPGVGENRTYAGKAQFLVLAGERTPAP